MDVSARRRKNKSTRRPWALGFGADTDPAYYIVSGTGRKTVIAKLDTDNSRTDAENAALILIAVNHYERLVETLKLAQVWLANCTPVCEPRSRKGPLPTPLPVIASLLKDLGDQK